MSEPNRMHYRAVPTIVSRNSVAEAGRLVPWCLSTSLSYPYSDVFTRLSSVHPHISHPLYFGLKLEIVWRTFFSRLRLMHEPTQRRDMHIFLLCREVYCTDCRVIFCGRRRFERWCQRRLRSIVLTRAADGGVNFAPVALSSFTVCSGFSPQ